MEVLQVKYIIVYCILRLERLLAANKPNAMPMMKPINAYGARNPYETNN